MPFSDPSRRPMLRSLRAQSLLAAAAVALLITAGGLIAVDALRVLTVSVQSLAGERMSRMQDIQELEKLALLVERETYLLAEAGSADAVRDSYQVIEAHLRQFDLLTNRLATASGSDNLDVLDLYQSSQLFRNTANVLAQLRTTREDSSGAPTDSLRQVAAELRRQAGALVASTEKLSGHFGEDFYAGLAALSRESARRQTWGAAALTTGVLLGSLVVYGFFGRRVLRRLDRVSMKLRQSIEGRQPPDSGRRGDEIDEMSLAVDEFLKDRATLRAFFDALPDLAWMKDTEGRYLACNPLFERFFGAPEANILGKTDFDFVDADLAAFFRAMDQKAIDEGGPHANEEEITFADDGRRALLETIKTPVHDAAGRLIGVLGIGREITERKQTELAREVALDEALRLAQMRSVFMAQMSHELRTPLNGILGYAQNLLLGGSLSDKEAAGLNVIKHSGEHLLSLINGLLDHAAIEADKFELIPDDIRLEEFLAGLISIVRVRAEQKNVAFTCELEDSLPGMVRGDAQRLRQVLLNLLSNAVKFTDGGEVVLRVQRAGTARMRFEVRDSGVGIAPDQLEKIFLPFEQAGEVSRRAGGSGLGLAISRKLVQLMGGDIRVESRPGDGSTFWFEIDMETVKSDAGTVDVAALAGQAANPVAQPADELFVPTSAELEVLSSLVQRGSMRDVQRYAEQLQLQDERYGPFAEQLRTLAKGFQTKALRSLIEHYLQAQGGGQ